MISNQNSLSDEFAMRWFTCFAILLLSFVRAWAGLSILPVGTLLAFPETYDGQSVCVDGTAENIRGSVSSKGNAYFTLDIRQGAHKVHVFSFGKTDLQNGQTVLSCGRFHRENKVGENTFHDELTACLVDSPPGLFGPALQAGRSPEFSGEVTSVLDGDTLDVLAQHRPRRVRLEGVDCPEKGQDFGARSKQYTASKIFGKRVTVTVVNIDKYGRMVAWVRMEDDRLLNEEILLAGMGWWYRKYAPDNKTLESLEAEARSAKRGLWAEKNPLPPWEFRHPRGALALPPK
ncbi:MAG: thermonuclease family protein [Elusimicrobia bacterium]|nr:thermonuclease family protein [Elusimicrobiota bacterium]